MAFLFVKVFCTALALVVASHIIQRLASRRRRGIPGPLLASVTSLWLFYQCRRGRRYLAVDEAHKAFGKIVSIQPRHYSIADIDAIQAIYGHTRGFVKSDYYDAFAGPGHRSIFNTRSRDEHSRKRRSVAHIFSPKSARQFEQYVRSNITNLVSEWTKIGQKDSIAAKDGYNSFNVLPWLSYLAFDITGDLVFGAPFDMLSRAQDLVDERKTYDSDPTCVAAIGVLNRQGDISATLGCIPQLKPFSKYLPDPFFRIGSRAVDHMAGIAIERVSRRIKGGTIAESTRIDILAKLMESMNDRGEILGRDELMTEALTFLVAGSNSTAITLATMIHYVVSTPCVLKQLQAAIDEVVPAGISIPTYDMVKCVPYLDWVIWETLRFHSAFALGLPRQIPAGSSPVKICGKLFYAGDVLSVPTYTLHHSKEVWGSDADSFDPERWDSTTRLTAQQKSAFLPFSTGPRACIGRNLAELELRLTAAAIFRNFDFKLGNGSELEYTDGFVRRPTAVIAGVKRRA